MDAGAIDWIRSCRNNRQHIVGRSEIVLGELAVIDINPPITIHHEFVFVPAGLQLDFPFPCAFFIFLERKGCFIPVVEVSENEYTLCSRIYQGKLDLLFFNF